MNPAARFTRDDTNFYFVYIDTGKKHIIPNNFFSNFYLAANSQLKKYPSLAEAKLKITEICCAKRAYWDHKVLEDAIDKLFHLTVTSRWNIADELLKQRDVIDISEFDFIYESMLLHSQNTLPNRNRDFFNTGKFLKPQYGAFLIDQDAKDIAEWNARNENIASDPLVYTNCRDTPLDLIVQNLIQYHLKKPETSIDSYIVSLMIKRTIKNDFHLNRLFSHATYSLDKIQNRVKITIALMFTPEKVEERNIDVLKIANIGRKREQTPPDSPPEKHIRLDDDFSEEDHELELDRHSSTPKQPEKKPCTFDEIFEKYKTNQIIDVEKFLTDFVDVYYFKRLTFSKKNIFNKIWELQNRFKAIGCTFSKVSFDNDYTKIVSKKIKEVIDNEIKMYYPHLQNITSKFKRKHFHQDAFVQKCIQHELLNKNRLTVHWVATSVNSIIQNPRIAPLFYMYNFEKIEERVREILSDPNR